MLTLVLELNCVNCMKNSQSHVLVIVNRDAVTALIIVLQICSEQVEIHVKFSIKTCEKNYTVTFAVPSRTVCYTTLKGSVKVLHDAFWLILELQSQVPAVPGIHLMSIL